MLIFVLLTTPGLERWLARPAAVVTKACDNSVGRRVREKIQPCVTHDGISSYQCARRDSMHSRREHLFLYMPEITSRLSTALADRYRIERHLGEGGMATVYLAEDLKLHLASGGQRRLHTALTRTSPPLQAGDRDFPTL